MTRNQNQSIRRRFAHKLLSGLVSLIFIFSPSFLKGLISSLHYRLCLLRERKKKADCFIRFRYKDAGSLPFVIPAILLGSNQSPLSFNSVCPSGFPYSQSVLSLYPLRDMFIVRGQKEYRVFGADHHIKVFFRRVTFDQI